MERLYLKKKETRFIAVKHGSRVITLRIAGVHCSVEWNFSKKLQTNKI